MNIVELLGRLVQSIKLTKCSNGAVCTNFTLACHRYNKTKPHNQETNFIHCNVYGEPAIYLAQNTKKGSLIALTGYIQTNVYKHSDGRIKFYWTVNSNHIVAVPTSKHHTKSVIK